MKIKNIFGKNKIKELNENDSTLLKLDKKAIEEIKFDEIIKEESKIIKEKKTIRTVLEEKKHYQGHRARLREKVLKYGTENLKDYELLEALLTLAIPRSDVKPLAKSLIDELKTFKNILLAENQKLKKIKGVGESTQYFFKLIHEACARLAKEEIMDEILLDNIEKVVHYCNMRMSNLPYEQFRVLFLNRKNKLILDEILQSGTIDKAAIFPRELVKRAIEIGAGALILVHNHPTGDPTPSKADIETTINIQKAANLMEVYLYDHIIIGKNKHYSMRSNNFQ